MDADDPFGSIIFYSVSASDIVDLNPLISCSQNSGTVFSIGTTTVTCTATDSSGNESGSDSFNVTVLVSSITFDGFVAKLDSMGLQKGIETSLSSKINAAAKSFERGNTNTALNQLDAFINEVEAQDSKKLSEENAALLLECANLLINNL